VPIYYFSFRRGLRALFFIASNLGCIFGCIFDKNTRKEGKRRKKREKDAKPKSVEISTQNPESVETSGVCPW